MSYSKLNALECEYGFWKSYVDTNTDISITITESNTVGSDAHAALTHLQIENRKLSLNVNEYSENIRQYLLNVLNSRYNNNINEIITDYSDIAKIEDLNMQLYVKPDLVIVRDNDVIIVEFKTFTMKFTKYEQLYIYLYGILNTTDESKIYIKDMILSKGNVKLLYHYLNENYVEYVELNVNQDTINEISNKIKHVLIDSYYKLDKIVRADMTNNIESLRINKNTSFCKYCTARGICPASKEIIRFVNSIDETDYESLSLNEKLQKINSLTEAAKDYKRRIEQMIQQLENELLFILSTLSESDIKKLGFLKISNDQKEIVDKNVVREFIYNKLLNDPSEEFVRAISNKINISKQLLKELKLEKELESNDTNYKITKVKKKIKFINK